MTEPSSVPVIASRIESASSPLPRISPQRIWIARGLAVVADAVQLAAFPVTVEGAISPVSDGIDALMAVVQTLLVGWHLAFVPSFLVKLLPVADLAPTWTLAVLVATRGGARNTLPIGETLSSLPLMFSSDPLASRRRKWLALLREPIGKWLLTLGVLTVAAMVVIGVLVLRAVNAHSFSLP